MKTMLRKRKVHPRNGKRAGEPSDPKYILKWNHWVDPVLLAYIGGTLGDKGDG